MGRPKLEPGQHRKQRLIGFTDAEWEAVRRTARAGGRTLSHYVRMCALGTKYSAPKKDSGRLSAVFGTPLRAAKIDPWPGDLFLRDAEKDYGPGHWLHVEDVRYWPRLRVTVRHLDRWGRVLVVEGDAWDAYIAPYTVTWAAPVRPPPR